MARIKGTRDDDTLSGTDLDDVIVGLAGNDDIYGADGNDRVSGGEGADYVFGGGGDDTLDGGDSDDYLYGGDGNDRLIGGDGPDLLFGEAGDDIAIGGAGDDVFRGGAGIDRFEGGDGLDRVSFGERTATQGAIVDLGRQIVVNDGFGNRETLMSVESIGAGTFFADVFRGGDGSDFISISKFDRASGGGGDDSIYVDSLEGVRVDGGAGFDLIGFGTSYQTIDESGRVTTVYADNGVTVNLETQTVADDGFGHTARISGFEAVRGGGRDDVLTGSRGADSLDGGDFGDDRIIGGGGNDTIRGGFGNDRLTGGAGRDVFVYAPYGRFDDTYYDGVSPATYAVDTILDFTPTRGETRGDRIDLSGMTGEFRFIGTADFSGIAGEVRYAFVDGKTVVTVESDGRAGVDLTIDLAGTIDLSAADFIL